MPQSALRNLVPSINTAMNNAAQAPFGRPQRIPIYRNEPEFIDRSLNPQNYPVINNPDGSISSHRMAAEVDENGNWYVFPTIQMQPDGTLRQYDDAREAMKAAFMTGNILRAPNMKSALQYAEGGYKVGTPMEQTRSAPAQEPVQPASDQALRALDQAYMMGIGQGPAPVRVPKTRGQTTADVLGAASIPMSAVPIAGDITGILADAAMYAAYPEERTFGNYAMSVLGGLPLIPGAAALRAMRNAPTVTPGEVGFDPRFDDRVKEQQRIAGSRFNYSQGSPIEIPELSIYDLEGKPFILGMADRTAAGKALTGIDNVTFDVPVELRGGQDYMFYNPGQVWSSDKGPVSAMMNAAARTPASSALGGVVENPLFLPFRMAPSGGDYSTMVTDAMLSYARSNMTKKTIRAANKDIKAIFPDFMGIENPQSMAQLYAAGGDVRKSVQQILDKKYRDEGGINLGQARLSATDPSQYNAMDVGLGNVGVIEQGRPRYDVSGHPTYQQGIPGYGLGTLKEQDISAFDLLPDMVRARGVNINNPDPKDIYTLRLGVQSGRITDDILRSIEQRRSNQM